jgi:hypothetical protein
MLLLKMNLQVKSPSFESQGIRGKREKGEEGGTRSPAKNLEPMFQVKSIVTSCFSLDEVISKPL